jgi:uncharacterized protein (DUF305 family)
MKDTSTMERYLSLPALAVAAAVVLSGCGGSDNSPATTSPAAVSASAAASESAAGHNSADTMFAQMMIPHHQQAKEMSQVILAKDAIDPKVKDMADRIAAAQTAEILQMQSWLEDWNEPSTVSGSLSPGATDQETSGTSGSPSPYMGGNETSGTSGSPDMGGMQEQMKMLEKAQGTQAERLFLIQMSAHHETAVQIAEQEVKYGSDPEAVALAEKIVQSQKAEIQEMKGLLASPTVSPSRAP